MARFVDNPSCVPGWLPLELPCWVVTFLIWAIPTAIVLDVIVYYIYPKIIKPLKIKGESFPLPNIPVPVPDTEVRRLFKVIERKLDKRSKALKKAGIQIEKKIDNGRYSYRFFYSGQLLYHFSMTPDAKVGSYSIGFDDGQREEIRTNKYTAFGKIHATLGVKNPTISVRSLSLLGIQGVPLIPNNFSYKELADLIWEKTSKTIEQEMRRIT